MRRGDDHQGNVVSDAYEADPQVTRKDEWWNQPDPEPWICVSCDREVKPDRWLEMTGRTQDKPPFCPYCVRNFGHFLRPNRITRGDHRVLLRLNATVHRLQWEIRNGPTVRAFTPR